MADSSLSENPVILARADFDRIKSDLERAVCLVTSMHSSLYCTLSQDGQRDNTAATRVILEACLEKVGGLIDRALGNLNGEAPDIVGTMDAWADLGCQRVEGGGRGAQRSGQVCHLTTMASRMRKHERSQIFRRSMPTRLHSYCR